MGIRKAAASILLAMFAGVVTTAETGAQSVNTPAPQTSTTPEADALRYIAQMHLAFINTPSATVNNEAMMGLQSLAVAMGERTATIPAGTVGLNIESDELLFFPFIYWPVTTDMPDLSDAAKAKVQAYLNNGGVILFDTRDGGTGAATQRLQRLLNGITIKPLTEMADDHTLSRTFYLVSGLAGSGRDQTLWVENEPVEGARTVSSVLIGGTNWAGAWAGTTMAQGSRDQEMALRAGINMVIYSLTGTYKDDLVHLPALLERMGRRP